jgi:hypothetical protein
MFREKNPDNNLSVFGMMQGARSRVTEPPALPGKIDAGI